MEMNWKSLFVANKEDSKIAARRERQQELERKEVDKRLKALAIELDVIKRSH